MILVYRESWALTVIQVRADEFLLIGLHVPSLEMKRPWMPPGHTLFQSRSHCSSPIWRSVPKSLEFFCSVCTAIFAATLVIKKSWIHDLLQCTDLEITYQNKVVYKLHNCCMRIADRGEQQDTSQWKQSSLIRSVVESVFVCVAQQTLSVGTIKNIFFFSQCLAFAACFIWVFLSKQPGLVEVWLDITPTLGKTSAWGEKVVVGRGGCILILPLLVTSRRPPRLAEGVDLSNPFHNQVLSPPPGFQTLSRSSKM